METITISTVAYNNAKLYAESQHMGVDELIVTLINKLTYPIKDKKKYSILPKEQLEPELQAIMDMHRKDTPAADDLNGERARLEYYQEKYGL